MSMKILWQIIHILEVSMEGLAAGRKNIFLRAVSILKQSFESQKIVQS